MSKARTVISAVRARHELLVSTLEWEPRLQIVLLRRSKIQRAANNSHKPIRDLQALVKALGVGDHAVEHLPALLRIGDAELLDLLKLVHAEDAPHVAPGAAGFFAEARRVACVLHGKLGVGRLEPFFAVEGGDGLFGGSNQVLLVVAAYDLYHP